MCIPLGGLVSFSHSYAPVIGINTLVIDDNGLSQQRLFLRRIFGNEEGIQQAIATLRQDRFHDRTQLTGKLKEAIRALPQVIEELVHEDPLLALLVLTLNNDPQEDYLREKAADAYIAKYPEDTAFEKHYAYLKIPHVLLAHLFIITHLWQSADPENRAFYDEQLAGLFQGTLAFDKGDRLSPEELQIIQMREGLDFSAPIPKQVEEKDGGFEVKSWYCTPCMCSSSDRLSDLYIESRLRKQKEIVENYLSVLKASSPCIQEVYALPLNTSTVVAVIGPYGAGKSHYVQQKFSGEKKITPFNLDQCSQLLRTPASRDQDHHFEAMMVKSSLLSRLSEVPAILTETAAIDSYRFNRMITKDFVSRNLIVIEEIAPEKPADAVNRFIQREGTTDYSRLGAAATSANDALKFRAQRIDTAKHHNNIRYTLYCKPSEGETLITVAKIQEGKIAITEGREELFHVLTS